jgi:hypothetical protein
MDALQMLKSLLVEKTIASIQTFNESGKSSTHPGALQVEDGTVISAICHLTFTDGSTVEIIGEYGERTRFSAL